MTPRFEIRIFEANVRIVMKIRVQEFAFRNVKVLKVKRTNRFELVHCKRATGVSAHNSLNYPRLPVDFARMSECGASSGGRKKNVVVRKQTSFLPRSSIENIVEILLQ